MRALAALVLLVGCDAAMLGERPQAIVGGQLDPGDPAVVAVVARRVRCEDSVVPIECSGTVIAPRAVLTAAHCLLPGTGRGTLEVYVGAQVGEPAGRFIAVSDAVRDPAYDTATHAHDLAVLRLAEDAPVTPVALPAATLDVTSIGIPARIVGYGVTAVGTIADGQRRQATMAISAIGAVTFTATPMPGNSCSGDSGGPVFATLAESEQLIGVTSSGDARCMTDAIDARVDVAIAGFIRPALAMPDLDDGPIALDDVCGSPCDTAADCPAAMACAPDDRGVGRCEISPGPAGNYGATCSTDGQCGTGSCARITGDVCRCELTCDQVAMHTGSCAAAGGGTWGSALALLIACRRRRSARRAAGGSTRGCAVPARAR